MPVRGVVFQLESELPSEAKFLLEDFRLAVNNAIRAGLQARVSSRNALAKLAYKDFRKDHPRMYSQHLVSAFEVAGSVLKNHRRRLRRGLQRHIPYVKRLMMKAENQAYKLDRVNGVIDLPIRAGLHVELRLVVSQYHRRYLDDHALSLGSLTVLPDRVVVAFRKGERKPYVPETVLSLDTNERSLDGVFFEDGVSTPARAAFDEVAVIQARHHDRRKRLQKKKAHDRRTSRRLCRKEGRREHRRIEYRMHQVANAVAGLRRGAEGRDSARGPEGVFKPRRDKVLNRRLSMWPRRKLHQIIEYKAAWRGMPVVKVDPIQQQQEVPDMWEDTTFPNGRPVRVRVRLAGGQACQRQHQSAADSLPGRDGRGLTVQPRRVPA